jgi:hypothetical protein
MFIKLNLFIVVCISTFGFQTQSCRPTENDRINRMGPDVHAELVFFFKKGVSADEIFEFQRTVIGIPNEKNSGYASLPGMMTTVAIEINGYDGEAINFKPNATEEQKAFVKKRVVESPLIYRVYENVVPDEIKDLPNAKDMEKVNSDRTPDARPTREPVKGVITPNP